MDPIILDASVPVALTLPADAPLVCRRATSPAQPFQKRPALVGKAIDAVLKDIPEWDNALYICRY
ncbi:MAG TPA: hypothetical protein VGY75_07410 [Candidatus Udaeobacter sp.]|nr:hypothetical protein [Candidatus Udaeobacter sp.]